MSTLLPWDGTASEELCHFEAQAWGHVRTRHLRLCLPGGGRTMVPRAVSPGSIL